mgnify:FL=1
MFDDIIGKPPLQEKFIDELWQRLKEPIDNKILEWLQISVWKITKY